MSAPGPSADAAAGLDPEDVKLVRLARSAAQRAYVPVTGSGQGAAVRDSEGRTYAAATVEAPPPATDTSALRAALTAAYASGARSFEAVALVGDDLAAGDEELLTALAAGVPVLLVAADGDTRILPSP